MGHGPYAEHFRSKHTKMTAVLFVFFVLDGPWAMAHMHGTLESNIKNDRGHLRGIQEIFGLHDICIGRKYFPMELHKVRRAEC
jgi:hypothetical protein